MRHHTSELRHTGDKPRCTFVLDLELDDDFRVVHVVGVEVQPDPGGHVEARHLTWLATHLHFLIGRKPPRRVFVEPEVARAVRLRRDRLSA